MSAQALSDLKVIEYAELISGPMCSKLFADMGAEVIKIEPPGVGDEARSMGPFPGDVPHPERSGLFLYTNTSKRGVTLDPSTARGKQLFLELVRWADILVENQHPALIKELGLDYPNLERVNPRLVMVSITPFGQSGPYAHYKAQELNTFHFSGTGHRYVGRPDAPPLRIGGHPADIFGAVNGAAAALGALWGRDATGEGQQVDVSTAECIATLFVGGLNISGYFDQGIIQSRTGVGLGVAAPATVMPCKDGHVWMLAVEDHQWQGLARAMGNPEWMQDPLFTAGMLSRGQHADAIYPLVEAWALEHTKMEIMELAQQNNCPITAVLTTKEVVENEHLNARGFFVEVDHPETGPLKYPGAPFKMTETPWQIQRSAPRLGEHNEEVFCGLLGLSREELVALRRTGVI